MFDIIIQTDWETRESFRYEDLRAALQEIGYPVDEIRFIL